MSAVKPVIGEAESPLVAASPDTSPTSRFLLALLGLSIALYFVVRSWLTAGLVIAGLVSLCQSVVHLEQWRGMLHQRRVRWLLVALCAPLAAAVVVNLWQGEFVWRSLDVPVRLLLAGALMVELARRRLDVMRIVHYAIPAALLVCAAWIYLAPQAPKYFWGGRFATSFMDPLMLSQHAMIGGFLSLFLASASARTSRLLAAIQLAAAVLAVMIALGTLSRTGWMMAPLLGILWMTRASGKVTPWRLGLAVAGVLIVCALAYWGSDVVQLRVSEAREDITGYMQGTLDSSVGHRISLFRIALLLFAERPLLGWGFGALPDLSTFAPAASFYSPLLDHYFVMAGVHNEFLQAMMRMGLAGLISKLLLYGIPLLLFARATRSREEAARTSGYLGLVVVVGYVTAGMSSEVTNLLYGGSFYGFMVAAFAAGTFRERSA